MAKWVFIVLVIITVGVFFFPYIQAPDTANPKYANCVNNLRTIGLMLDLYANDNNDLLPPNFETLAAQNYPLEPKVFFCPESGNKPPKQLSQMNWDKIDYYYVQFPGAKWGGPDANDCIVVLDCAGNHRNCGYVLFANGQVKQFRGYEWYREAGLDLIPDNSNMKSNKGMDQ